MLPDIELTDNGLAGTLTHEIIHCRRGDLYVKLAALLARSLHWFNPLAHMAALRCETEMELSCDEAVLEGCGEDIRAAYGAVMLYIIKKCRRNTGTLTTHFNPKKNAVMVRITNILYGSGKRRGRLLIAVCVVLCVFAGTFIACSITDGETAAATEEQESDTAEGSSDNDILADAPEDTETDAFQYPDEIEPVTFPYTDKVFPKPVHWEKEQLGIVEIEINTSPAFAFRLYEWNSHAENSETDTGWNFAGLVWTIAAYTRDEFARTAEHYLTETGADVYSEFFGEMSVLIGTDSEYAYVLTLPSDDDYAVSENYKQLQAESQAVLQNFISVNGITPNPSCPDSVVYSPAAAKTVYWSYYLSDSLTLTYVKTAADEFYLRGNDGGGPLIDLGVHVIDLSRYLAGCPKPVSAYGVTFNNLGCNRADGGETAWELQSSKDGYKYTVEDFASAMVRFDNGFTL